MSRALATGAFLLVGTLVSQAHAQSCVAPTVLGDVLPGVEGPVRVPSVDAMPAVLGSAWREVVRLTEGSTVIVGLEEPGNAAGLVVLAPAESGFCVTTIFGDAFGGLGVSLAVSDVLRTRSAAGDALLVAVELMRTYNDGPDGSGDPDSPRRVVVRIDATGGALLLDTSDARLARYAPSHFYFEQSARGTSVIAIGPAHRWRYDEASGALRAR